MKKFFISIFVIGFIMVGSSIQAGHCQQVQDLLPSTKHGDLLSGFIQNMIQSISYRAADMAYDYTKRPVMGVLVADFFTTSGEEIVLGNDIAAELRATLNKGKQFHVYGKEHPVSQSLKTVLAKDPQWSGASQRKFQQDLLNNLRPFPVDLIITGQVSKEMTGGDKLKIVIQLTPFIDPITLVESETGKTEFRREHFISSPLPPDVIGQALLVIKTPVVPKGRLMIVSFLNMDKGKEALFDATIPQDKAKKKLGAVLFEKTWKISSLKDINCWLDDKGLTTSQDWPEDKKKTY
ncbi:MAG: hypothetical protein C0407_06110, partial [Desulfobacca sp.]|nr:hypothetical protein [Desulfobacca sp.]